MANVTEWADLWELTKNLLLLSHGQASVERGFSINKEISVENMTVQTLISQRVIIIIIIIRTLFIEGDT